MLNGFNKFILNGHQDLVSVRNIRSLLRQKGGKIPITRFDRNK